MKWLPLPKIAYGIAIYPFSPSNVQQQQNYTRPASTTHDDASIISSTSTDHQPQTEDYSHFISLEVGDEVFIIEQQAQWYRGYVLSVQEQGLKPNKAPIGCFPRTHVQIKEYLDLEQDQVEPRRREISSSSSQTPTGLLRSFSESHISSQQPNHDIVRPGSLNLDLEADVVTATQHIPPPPLPYARFDQSTITGCSEPLVDEIAACVSEWNSLLYTYINKRKYQTFNNVRDHINYLFQARRQLLDQALSREELIKLRKEIVQRMVTCNMELHQEMIIRHPEKGYLLDTTNTSTSNIYRMHWKYANKSTTTTNDDNNTTVNNMSTASLNNSNQLKGAKFYHLFFELKACIAHICQPGEYTELYFALYSSAERKFITEQFVVVLTFNGMPKDETQIGKLQALFVDLSLHDMSDSLYMVCHIVRLGGMKLTENKDHFGHTSQFFLHGNKHSSIQKAMPSITNTCRRPFGCAVLNLSTFQSEHETTEYDMPIYTATSESNYSTLHEDIILDHVKEFVKHPRAEMLRISLRSFYGFIDEVLKTNAALLQDVPHTLRLGFADVAFPNETRNELYIKLDAGDFSQRSRNIQVSMCVRDNKSGQVIDNAICVGAKPVSYWTSMVIYHEQRPKWGELVKIQIQDLKQWERSHVFITVKHKSTNNNNSNNIIAMGFLPLFLPPFHRDFVADGSHTICMYKYDKQYSSYSDALPWCAKSSAPSNMSSEVKVVKPYRKFGHQHSPSNQSFNGSFNSTVSAFNVTSNSSEVTMATSVSQQSSKLVPMRDTITLSTFLCSTKFTQNKTLVKLLNWRTLLETSEEGTSELLAVLDQFTFVGEVEVVKFLNDILDALLDIMAYQQDKDELVNREINDQVLAAIIWLLGIVQDRRFSNFRPVLDVYIDHRFSNNQDTTYKHLMKSLTRLCENPSEASKAKLLRSSMKVWDYLFRFVVRSRLRKQQDDDGFNQDMDKLLLAITQIMSPEHPNAMIGTQTLALQHFADILVELQKIFTCQQVVATTISFVDACSHVTGRLVGFKLAMILSIVKGPIFDDASCRPEIAKHIFRWIRLWVNSYMATAKDVIFARQVEQQQLISENQNNPQQTRLPRAQWIENLRLSLTIMSELLDKVRKSVGMTSSGLTSSCISSPSVSTYSRPTSFAAVPEEDDYLQTGLSLIIEEALQLVPQLLNAYKDLQRLTIQAIHVSSTPSAVIETTTGVSNQNSRPHSRQSFSILRERASSIGGGGKGLTPEILQELTSAAKVNGATNGAATTPVNGSSANKSKFTVVLQALSTSPTVPFPSTYPFQPSTHHAPSKDSNFTSDHVAMVSTGLLDLTVVLLELFYLTPKPQWSAFIKKMYEQDGIEMTAEFLRKMVYTCMGILFGDNVMTLEESSLTVDNMARSEEDESRDRRKLPHNWLNLNVIAHQIVLCDILDPIKSILEVPAFVPSAKAYMTQEDEIDPIQEDDEEEELAYPETPQFNDPKTKLVDEQRSALLLWRVYFVGFLRVIGSPRLDVSEFTPQTQRAVWKIIGNMRSEVCAKTFLFLWKLAGQSGPAFIAQDKVQSDYFGNDLQSPISSADYFSDTSLRKSMASIEEVDDGNEFNTNTSVSGQSTTLTNTSTSVRNSVRIAPTDEVPLSSINEENYAAITTDVPFLQVDLAYFVLSPLCAVCLTLHDRVRKNALSIIADIIAIELYSFGELINVQHTLIGALDRLIMSKNKADEEVASRITNELGQLLDLRLHNDNRTDIQVIGKRVVESLTTFMNLLLQIRSLPSDDEYNDERITATLRLMKFIQVIEREEIYIKYVHQLVQLHLESNNYIEAALTLRFHSDLLQWDPSDKLAPIQELSLPIQSSFTRKESLYMTMLKYLDRGSAWEICIQICKELAYEYENTLYDYSKLGEILQRQATFVENIAKKERCFTEYFRVGFYGRGFPASNRNTQYIYRGLEWEKMPSFIERMQNRHPNAQLLPSKIANSVSITDEQLKELNSTIDGQYLQITPVTPIPDAEMVPCLSNPNAPDSIKKYYSFNNVSKFSFSRPVTKETEKSEEKQPESDFLNLWTEKIEFECEDKFPTIVRRSKIIHSHADVISPVENAVAAVENKNKELESLERKYAVHLPKNSLRVSGLSQSVNINPFSMSLNGAVDAPVNGGIPLYKKAFLSKEYYEKNPDMRQWIYRLQAAIEDQVLIIQKCLETHNKLVSTEMRPFHTTLLEFFHKNFADELKSIKEKSTEPKEKPPLSITTTSKNRRRSTLSNSTDNASVYSHQFQQSYDDPKLNIPVLSRQNTVQTPGVGGIPVLPSLPVMSPISRAFSIKTPVTETSTAFENATMSRAESLSRSLKISLRKKSRKKSQSPSIQ